MTDRRYRGFVTAEEKRGVSRFDRVPRPVPTAQPATGFRRRRPLRRHASNREHDLEIQFEVRGIDNAAV